jgi:hypothetical protein
MMYEISPISTINSSDFAATNMVLTPPVNVFMADQHIAALEQEIFALQSAERGFNEKSLGLLLSLTNQLRKLINQLKPIYPKPQKIPNLCLNQNQWNNPNQCQLNPQHTLSLMSAMHPTNHLMSKTLLLYQNQQRIKN